MSSVYWDTMLFVYLLEANDVFGARTQAILTKMTEREDTLCTSVFTLGELLTGPLKRNAVELASRIRQTIRRPHVELLQFDEGAAETYAELRAKHGVTPADAIHLACASRSGTDLFLTNDRKVQRLLVPGIGYIAGLDVNLY